MVARDGIEPPPPAFSGLASTAALAPGRSQVLLRYQVLLLISDGGLISKPGELTTAVQGKALSMIQEHTRFQQGGNDFHGDNTG